jgi:dTDP-4-amino-4,6-dideoxygalactose transaminase
VRRGLETDKDVVGVVIAPCYGVPAPEFNEILALCKERGIWICEDACESYGALMSAQGGAAKVPIGAQATLCVVSVRSEKMVGVGEGGAILGNDTTLVARAKWWCSRAPRLGCGLWRVYEHDAVGQNFRLPEMLAAVGCAAAEMLPVMIERKRSIHSWYESEFTARPELQGVQLQKAAAGDEPVWWMNAALLPAGLNGEKVGMKLMETFPDIEIRPGFFPLNIMGIFKSEWNQPCPNAEALYERLVCLPSSHQLQHEDITRVCGALVDAIKAVSSTA